MHKEYSIAYRLDKRIIYLLQNWFSYELDYINDTYQSSMLFLDASQSLLWFFLALVKSLLTHPFHLYNSLVCLKVQTDILNLFLFPKYWNNLNNYSNLSSEKDNCSWNRNSQPSLSQDSWSLASQLHISSWCHLLPVGSQPMSKKSAIIFK